MPCKKINLIPIPLHKKRENQRGFNQAKLLAENIALYFNLPLLNNALIKTKATPPQADLKGRQRRENIKNAFSCLSPDLVQNKTILLIDDVTTTGATLQQAAKVLKQAGARSVWSLVIAKG